jgi:hypothetical protein
MLVPLEQQEAVLNALGLNPRDARVQALALVAQRYDLDLVLKHVFLIQGTVYVSHAGLLHLAHKSGKLDGLEVEITEKQDRWTATAKVWRKDMRMPFVYTDDCLKNEQKVVDKRKRAITRAERNALRRAFDIGVDVYEDDDRTPPPTLSPTRPELPGGGGGPHVAGLEASREGVPEPPSPSTLDARKSVVIRCREMGLDDDERHLLVRFVTNGRTESAKEITQKEAGMAHKLLHALNATGEAPWRGNTPTTQKSSGSSQPSSASPVPTTSPSEQPPGDGA